jgi:uncharacterized protein (DUF1501 family)
MLSRREFLHRSSLVSLYPVVPLALGRVASAAAAEPDAKVLVVIQLDGGNDGINTVVPYGDDAYGRNRDALRLDAEKLHKLNDHVGLHPQMRAAKSLFDDGRLTIVPGVGYPNPDRSHFRSMRIWQTARFDDADHNGYGWLGSALDLDATKESTSQPAAIYAGPEELPVALWARRAEAMSLTNLNDLQLPFAANQLVAASESPAAAGAEENGFDLFVTRQVLSAYTAADQFQQANKPRPGAATIQYPQTQLAANLQLIAQLIRSGAGARVFYTQQGGYDTHAAQLYTHARLLSEFSEGLKAFLDDLKSADLEDRVIVVAFSEFGRRVKENASQGTDHGAAGPVFVAGSQSAGGLVGTMPSLTDLDDGDLKMTTDMREIYATILEDWLGINSTSILAGTFPKAAILKLQNSNAGSST